MYAAGTDDVTRLLERAVALPVDAEEFAALPPIIDVTGIPVELVDRARVLPTLTFTRIADRLPPADSPQADVVVPEHLARSLVRSVNATPHAALIVTHLLRATASLRVDDAQMLESIAYSALQSGKEYRRWLSQRASPSVAAVPEERLLRVTETPDSVDIALNRPSHANALNAALRHELVEVFTALTTDMRMLRLRGLGQHFCSGGDLGEFTAVADPPSTHALRTAQRLPGLIADVGNRLTAHVHGAVIGAGLELMAFAAHVTAAPDSRFRLPELRMGLLPGSGGTVSLPRRIGANRTLVMVLTGTVLSAREALAWGIVDEIR